MRDRLVAEMVDTEPDVEAGSANYVALAQEYRGRLERRVGTVPISALRPGDSPRLDGLDSDHIRTLLEIDGELPPILVHRGTMRAIDGMHREDAARAASRPSMPPQFFEGNGEHPF